MATSFIDDHFARLRDSQPRALSYCHAHPENLSSWQNKVRTLVRERLGIPKMHSAPRLLDARIESSEEVDGYIRERLLLRTEPDLEVPAFLLRPLGQSGKVPAVLALHGHGPGKIIPAGLPQDENDRRLIAEGERDYAVQAVRQGYIALAPDLRGFGELRLKEDIEKNAGCSCQRLSLLAMQIGRNLLGMRVWDLMAAVDYLQQRPDVDSNRIAATGNSGGGTATLFLAAMDTRIAAAIPSCYFCTWAASIQAVPHCACNFVPGLSNLIEMYDLAGLVAPRPMLIVAGREDPIFPIEGVEEAYSRLREIYTAAGCPDRLELFVGDGGHRYYSARVWPWLQEQFGRP
ncbi:MAG TPA: alpha/beta hydrolase family protein [Armatimonadota bacterium]|jgi:dienelactone hydrolase|nr:prolyl oligopeptidase family serine peptidase [Armatimonadota bacterium]HOM83896.1 alpha/beta hydrolase family protein [Armatimonadota bacterium]HPO74206.1 alpha/beta hydrolase family protein [Armatimonadota bacterium]HPT99358.1 alpha/beta hydrolase family protein [Armatimonadota bacterium]